MSLTGLRNRSSKYVRVVVIIAAGGMLAATFTGLGANIFSNRNVTSNQSPDDVVATVNGAAITRSAFDQHLEQVTSGQSVGLMAYSGMNAEALDQAVSDALTEQIAKSKGLTVTNADLDAAKKAIVSQLAITVGLSANASESDVSDKLSANGLSLDQYFNEDSERHKLLIQKYGALLRNANKVTEDDAKAAYTDYHTAHILISNKSRPDAQALALTNQIIQQLDKGADFAALVKQYSDDPGTKNKGGDDGWVTKDTNYVPEFLDAMKTLQKGQITQQPVVSPQFGYFIIKLYDTRSSLPKDFEKNKDSEIQQLQDKRLEAAYQVDLAKAQASEKLVIKDDRLRFDHELADLYKHMGTDGKFNQGDVQKLIKEYTELAKSLGSGASDQVAQIDADLGRLEGMTDVKDPKQMANLQIPYFVAALKAFGHADQDVDRQLAQLYQQVGDKNDAVTCLQAASSATFGNPQAHMQYSGTFRSLGRADLAANEMQLAVQESQQAPSGGPQGAMPGNRMPVTPPPATVGGKPLPGGTVSIPATNASSLHPGQVIGTQTIHIGPGGTVTQGGKSISINPPTVTVGTKATVKPGQPLQLITPHPVPVQPVAPVAPLTKPSVIFKPLPPKPASAPVPTVTPTPTTPAKP